MGRCHRLSGTVGRKGLATNRNSDIVRVWTTRTPPACWTKCCSSDTSPSKRTSRSSATCSPTVGLRLLAFLEVMGVSIANKDGYRLMPVEELGRTLLAATNTHPLPIRGHMTGDGFHSMSESRRMRLQLAGQTTEQLQRLEASWVAKCASELRNESTDPVPCLVRYILRERTY